MLGSENLRKMLKKINKERKKSEKYIYIYIYI